MEMVMLREDGEPIKEASMILVMGVTGSGKSRFINTLVAGSVKEYPGLYSGTRQCEIIQANVGYNTPVAIVDTPGLDDTTRSDEEVLAEITSFLTTQYQLGIPLRGVIYLHRITDNKMQGSALRNFEMFQRICGEDAMGNVVLATTMWDKLTDRAEGLQRDEQLRRDFWSLMESRGSSLMTFDGSKEMAETMIMLLLNRDDVVLEIQRELSDEQKALGDTAAGWLMAGAAEEALTHKDEQIEYLEQQLQAEHHWRSREGEGVSMHAEALAQQMEALEAERARLERGKARRDAKIAKETREKIAKEEERCSKWQTGVQIFAAVTGLTAIGAMREQPTIDLVLSLDTLFRLFDRLITTQMSRRQSSDGPQATFQARMDSGARNHFPPGSLARREPNSRPVSSSGCNEYTARGRDSFDLSNPAQGASVTWPGNTPGPSTMDGTSHSMQIYSNGKELQKTDGLACTKGTTTGNVVLKKPRPALTSRQSFSERDPRMKELPTGPLVPAASEDPQDEHRRQERQQLGPDTQPQCVPLEDIDMEPKEPQYDSTDKELWRKAVPASSPLYSVREPSRSIVSSPPKNSSSLDTQAWQKAYYEMCQNCNDAIADLEQVQAEYRKAASDLNRLQAERSYKVDDDTLIKAWRSLRYEIKNWAVNHFDIAPSGAVWKLALKGDRQTLTLLVKDYQIFLKSPTLRPALIQAYVWNELRDNVFRNIAPKRGLYWAADHDKELRLLRNLLNPGLQTAHGSRKFKEYHRWRAMTTSLMHEQVTTVAVQSRCEDLGKRIVSAVSPFASTTGPRLKQELIDIVVKAVELDVQLQSQRSIFIVGRMADQNERHFGFPLPQSREAESFPSDQPADQAQVLEAVVAPALFKLGDAAGESYDQ
ncbi:hypothetical protein LTR62_001691 [Meristemomyces frigidus]|uniref:AIG1-type G domain-containing protein n=1 Tax=Meristemomyces frigidus TaxID=1508187 RepID=A0AAN7T908_9PEZI|nr:hypothetical protein LTR62_001691 [Meristemomyces frigidus]